MTEQVAPLLEPLARALSRREALLAALAAENTDCMRLFHGVAEGAPGVTIDRYGPVLLVQTWRGPLPEGELEAVSGLVTRALGVVLEPVAIERRQGAKHGYVAPAESEPVGHELDLAYDVRPLHRGQDPLLFLDFRAARRWMLHESAGKDVLNLYAYTCGIGSAAKKGGARSVLNVDFSRSALDVGRANAQRNGLDEGCDFLQADAQVVVRRFAGLRSEGRRRQGSPPPAKHETRTFDIVVLDPPRWAKSAFGAVDVVRDYPSLFKPALLATAPSGVVLASNHVPSVDRDQWLSVLRRTAQKAGRPLAEIELIGPEADFPSFDGAPPLKIAICRLA